MDQKICVNGRNGRAGIIQMTASLYLETGLRNGITFLKRCYYTPPLKIADVTEGSKTATLAVMLMSASPGILDGDRYDMHFHIAAGTSIKMYTQGYQRLFTMKGKAAQVTNVHLESGARLHFMPHPVVPHKGADFSATCNIYLAGNCVLCWGEVLACGRKANGEVFQYTRYHNVTSIYHYHRLVMKENLLLQPGSMPVDAIGYLEGYTHMANLVYLDESVQVKEVIALVVKWLALQPGIVYGVSAAPVNGITVRLLGDKAEQLYECLLAVSVQLSVFSNQPA